MTCGKRVLRQTAMWALLAVLAAAPAWAQTDRGALRGAINDAQGVIPGAEVVVIDQATGALRRAMSNEAGEYAFANLRPGNYTVRVALPGFKASERTRLRVDARQSLVLNVMLEVGAIVQQITIVREAPLEGASIVEMTNRPSPAPALATSED